MTDAATSPFNGLTSALGRRWSMRDPKGYAHADTLDGPTPIQGAIASARGHDMDRFDTLTDPKLANHMPDPAVLVDMAKASRRLADAVERGEAITIFGDYDVDGATSTAIVHRYLRMAGHPFVSTVIPNRDYGYGYGPDALEDVLSDMPDLVLLLDCGTQNGDTIAQTRAMGTDVVVLDHHKPGPVLPDANALVNPHRADQPEEGLALRALCTAGLAFMLCAALNRELRARGRWATRTEPNVSSLLDLVALGTVCDVMPLVGLNRAFVVSGLKRLELRDNPGLAALSRVAGIKEGATVTNFGFHLGPRINAGGRVGMARHGADLLACEDPARCDEIANELNRLNQERQDLERAVQAEALEMVDPDADVIMVAGQNWHEGVIGIVAGRLKEIYDRPVIVMTIREDGIVKGSGRSISGVDLGTAVMEARAAGLLNAGGGHLMACGLTTTPERIDAFKAFILESIGAASAVARDAAATPVDATIRTSDICHGFHSEMERLGPYGQGWPKPRFVLGPAKAMSVRVTDKGHAFMELVDDSGSVEATAWRAGDSAILDLLTGNDPVLVLGHVDEDAYRGRSQIKFYVEDVIAVPSAPATSRRKAPVQYDPVDLLRAG